MGTIRLTGNPRDVAASRRAWARPTRRGRRRGGPSAGRRGRQRRRHGGEGLARPARWARGLDSDDRGGLPGGGSKAPMPERRPIRLSRTSASWRRRQPRGISSGIRPESEPARMRPRKRQSIAQGDHGRGSRSIPGRSRRGAGRPAPGREGGRRLHGTVSRAINRPEVVSPAARERIARAIQQLGWVPDGAARALTTGRSHTVGAVFPTLSVGDFARATQAIQAELLAAGNTLLLACSEYDFDRAGAGPEVHRTRRRRADPGRPAASSDLAPLLARRRMPHVHTSSTTRRRGRLRWTGQPADPCGDDGLSCRSRPCPLRRHRPVRHQHDRASARLDGVRDALAMRGARRPAAASGHRPVEHRGGPQSLSELISAPPRRRR